MSSPTLAFSIKPPSNGEIASREALVIKAKSK
jgi:hypothetical protein